MDGFAWTTATGPTGTTTFSAAIPDLAAMCGLELCFQCFVCDDGAPPPCDVSQTRGMRWRLGSAPR